MEIIRNPLVMIPLTSSYHPSIWKGTYNIMYALGWPKLIVIIHDGILLMIRYHVCIYDNLS